jgi:hypothetical protein
MYGTQVPNPELPWPGRRKLTRLRQAQLRVANRAVKALWLASLA